MSLQMLGSPELVVGRLAAWEKRWDNEKLESHRNPRFLTAPRLEVVCGPQLLDFHEPRELLLQPLRHNDELHGSHLPSRDGLSVQYSL